MEDVISDVVYTFKSETVEWVGFQSFLMQEGVSEMQPSVGSALQGECFQKRKHRAVPGVSVTAWKGVNLSTSRRTRRSACASSTHQQ